jgi:hypothetical protein
MGQTQDVAARYFEKLNRCKFLFWPPTLAPADARHQSPEGSRSTATFSISNVTIALRGSSSGRTIPKKGGSILVSARAERAGRSVSSPRRAAAEAERADETMIV